jgi:hypothetical protein
MTLNTREHVGTMVLLVLSIGTISCRQLDSQVKSERGNRTLFSKEDILRVANAEAPRHRWDPADCKILYDEGNVGWRQAVLETSPGELENGRFVWPDGTFEKSIRRWPQLKGRDYQAVSYWRKGPTVDGRYVPLFHGAMWILIDRETGRVLLVHAPP